MFIEIGYFTHATGAQHVCSLQGYDVNGLIIFASREDIEPDTFITVRTQQATLVQRIDLNKLHQISDYLGGNGNDDGATTTGLTYIDLGLVSLADNEDITITIDDLSSSVTATKIGVCAVIDDMPETDELTYAYSQHTDTSFNEPAATALYAFASSLATLGELINVKVGDDLRSTTFRSTNWAANVLGKIELDNTTMGVVYENRFGQPLTVNHSSTGVTQIVRTVVQHSAKRQAETTARLAARVAAKLRKVDQQTLRAST